MRIFINHATHSLRHGAALALLSACIAASCRTAAPPTETGAMARPRYDWETALKGGDISAKWRGADASYSVPLSDTHVLWLFGDTWIAPSGSMGRRTGRLIRNTIAIQRTQSTGLGYFTFHWSNDEAADTPMNAAPFFASDNDATWLWPLDGLRLGSDLVLFTSELKEGGGLGFASAGNVMLVVSDPGALPDRWQIRRVDIPFFRTTENGDRVFGLSVEQYGGYVYVYGVHENWQRGMGGRAIVVARVAPDKLVSGAFGDWRFFDGRDWAENVDEAAQLFDEAAAEMSVHYDEDLKRFVAVYSEFGLSENILVRFANAPEGPWSAPVTVYRCPDTKQNPNYFCYAAKAHPEFTTTPGELLVSYAVNSSEFEDHFADYDLYWPRFISVDIRRAFEASKRD